jgi:hypothetical protein
MVLLWQHQQQRIVPQSQCHGSKGVVMLGAALGWIGWEGDLIIVLFCQKHNCIQGEEKTMFPRHLG